MTKYRVPVRSDFLTYWCVPFGNTENFRDIPKYPTYCFDSYWLSRGQRISLTTLKMEAADSFKTPYRFVYNNVHGVKPKKTKLFIKISRRTFKPKRTFSFLLTTESSIRCSGNYTPSKEHRCSQHNPIKFYNHTPPCHILISFSHTVHVSSSCKIFRQKWHAFRRCRND